MNEKTAPNSPAKHHYTDAQRAIIDELSECQSTLGLTDARFAKLHLGGMSDSQWSKLRSATYGVSNIDKQFAELQRFLRSIRYKIAAVGKIEGGRPFHELDSFAAILSSVRECLEKPGENRLVIYVAPTGGGKSRLVTEVGKRETATSLRANESWRASYFFASLDIIDALGGTGKFSSAGQARREVIALLKGERKVLCIDEGNYFGPQSINLLKDVLNETEATVLLCCTPQHYDKMRRHWGEWSQLQRRVHSIFRYQPVTPSDAMEFLKDAGLNGDSKAAAIVLAKAANHFGAFDFIARTIERVVETASETHPRLADVEAAIAFVKAQLGITE